MSRQTRRGELVPTREVEFDGEVHALAVVGPGRSIPQEEKIKIALLVCRMYERNENTLDNILAYCGIASSATWMHWQNQIKEIKEAYKEAQELRDKVYRESLKQRARTQAERLIDGYVVQLEEETEQDVLNADGKVSGIKAKRKVVKQVLVRPSARLVEYALNNTDGKNFRKNPNPDDTFDDEVNIPPVRWVE